MSTRSIGDALNLLDSLLDDVDAGEGEEAKLRGARSELKALREAAKTLAHLHVGDFTYNIRDRAAGDPAFTGSTWEHPDVKAWSNASVLMGTIAKEGA